MAVGKIISRAIATSAITAEQIAPGAITGNDIPDNEISMAKLSQVNLAIAPEVLGIQVDGPAAGVDVPWIWTWQQSTLPYARRTITNSPELQVPLYKQGTYVIDNFAAYDIHGAMTQTHGIQLKWIDGAGSDNVVSWSVSSGPVTTTHASINGGSATQVQRLTVNVPTTVVVPTLNLPTGVTYTVANSGTAAYAFTNAANGTNPNIGPLYRGATYTFNVTASGHPFYLTTDNGTNFVASSYFGEYTAGVTNSRTETGSLSFTVPANAPDTLYYQCGNHSAMRGAITVKELAVETNNNGNLIIYAQHSQEGMKTPVEIRPIPSLVNQMCLVYDASSGNFVPQDLATYVENTPSFRNKIQEVAGTATLVAADGTAVVASVNVYSDSTYLPLVGNNAGDLAFATNNNSLYIWDATAWQVTKARTTDELAEGSVKLYYTDERVDDRVAALIVGGNNITATYNDTAGTLTIDGQPGYADSDVASYLSGNGYATSTSIIADITASAPATLDTLNEIAAALGDDPNFATTVTNSIATKMPLSGGIFTGAVTFGDYTLPTSDGTVAQVLTTDGSGTISFAPGSVPDGSITAAKLESSLKDYLEDTFVADGTQTTYTLSRTSISTNQLMVTVDGIVQPSTAYSVSSTTLTISPAIPNGTNVRVVHMGIASLVGYVPGTNLNFNDNVKATFGASSDLQIYHDGSNSYIDDAGEGSLFLRSGTTYIQNATGTKTSIVTNAGAGQTLYHNNTPVFETTATGIDVTGTVTADGLTMGSSSVSAGTGLFQQIQTAGNNMYVGIGSNNSAYVQANGEFRIATGGYQDKVTVTTSGNVGIGTDDPGFKLDVVTASADGIRTTSTSQTIIRLDTTNTNAAARNWQMAVSSVAHGDFNLTTSTTLGGDPANATSRLYINASGNVGIGTDNPGAKLSVSGPAALGNLGGGSTGSAALYVNSTSGHTGELIQVLRNGSTKMHMANDGKLGIGIANPNATLHVYGDEGNSVSAVMRLRGTNTTARTTRLQFEDYSGAIADGIIEFAVPNGNSTGAYMGMGYNGVSLKINSNGYVGIGGTDAITSQLTLGNTSNRDKITIYSDHGGAQRAERTKYLSMSVSPGLNPNQYFRLNLGAASAGTGATVRYQASFSTGHASGHGYCEGVATFFAHHGTSRQQSTGTSGNPHTSYARMYGNGSYYGWTTYPDIRFYLCNATGNNPTTGAAIYIQTSGHGNHNSGTFDLGCDIQLDLQVMNSDNNANPYLTSVGSSVPSDIAGLIGCTYLS
jgi:hypothetical protein